MLKWLARIKPESRKLIVMLVSVAAYVANALTGKRIDDETMWTVLSIVGVWLISQGVADAGTQGRAIAAARAAQRVPGAAAAVAAGLSADPAVEAEGPKPLNE
jgi:hypothetical protein